MTNVIPHYFKYWGKAEISNAPGNEKSYYHLLPYHGIDVASVGIALIKSNNRLYKSLRDIICLDHDTFNSLLYLFLSMHDLGKFSQTFQNLKPEIAQELLQVKITKPYSVRHDSLGLAISKHLIKTFLEEKIGQTEGCGRNRSFVSGLTMWQTAVSGHHGKPASRTKSGLEQIRAEDYFSPTDLRAAQSFVSDVFNLPFMNFLNCWGDFEVFKKSSKKFSWLLAGLTVLSDWIASNEAFFDYCKSPVPLSNYAASASLKAEKALNEIGLVSRKVSVSYTFRDLYPNIPTPSPLQELCDKLKIGSGPELFIIEDLTGSGKTEAAITVAHNIMKSGQADGIFIGMPTMATANSMYLRLSETYTRLFDETETPFLIVSHSASKRLFNFNHSVKIPINNRETDYSKEDESAGTLCSAWIGDNKKKAFLATVGVVTLDQALLAILPSKHQSLRLLGLNTKVLIIDEAHSYDPYTNRLLNKLIEFHSGLGGSTIVLSATLHSRLKQEFVDSFSTGMGISKQKLGKTDFPLLTQVSESECNQIAFEARSEIRPRISVNFLDQTNHVAETIKKFVDAGSCVCWIRNTVADAIDSFLELSALLGSANTILFHSRFTLGDRIRIEKEIIQRFGKSSTHELRSGQVLVATQVVEQSLDLDFDHMITDLAPVDLLIQRAGRLRRHVRDRKGNILPGGQTDDRDQTPLVILAPRFEENPGAKWYSDFFPKASSVYPFHGTLWLTAKILNKFGGWQFPDDARQLIESVYGSQSEPIPVDLERRDRRPEGTKKAERAMADLNSLDLEEGYSNEIMGAWLEDTLTPTRLGELRSTLRLARWDNDSLVPLNPYEDYPWAMNEVSVNSFVASEQLPIIDSNGLDVLNQVKEQMPDKLKWSILTPLEDVGNGLWSGKALNMNGKEVTIHYSKDAGLTYQT